MMCERLCKYFVYFLCHRWTYQRLFLSQDLTTLSLCSLFTGQLIDWQMIFYGTDSPPQTTSLTPSPVRATTTTQRTGGGERWTDVKTVDRSRINDFRDHSLDSTSGGCQRVSSTCLGWCLAIVFASTLSRSLATNFTPSTLSPGS